MRKADTRQGQFGRILIGLGIIMLALSLIVAATMPLRTSTELAPLFLEISHSPILARTARPVPRASAASRALPP